jgi:hypothetical protein
MRKCTVRYIVRLQCTFYLSYVRLKVRDSDVLAWVRGQRNMGQVLCAFGLLDFTMLRACPRLARVLKVMNRLFL